MNIDQIAEEATYDVRQYFDKPFYAPNVVEDEVLRIIKSAIEKASNIRVKKALDDGLRASRAR